MYRLCVRHVVDILYYVYIYILTSEKNTQYRGDIVDYNREIRWSIFKRYSTLVTLRCSTDQHVVVFIKR